MTCRILMVGAALLLLLMALSGVHSAPGQMSSSLLWKRLGLNRAIGDGRPQISSTKKRGESTVYFIKLPPQPHYYIPTNYLSASPYKLQTPDPFEKVGVDFTANGRPESVYHWNLPLGFTVPTTAAPTPTAPTTPAPASSAQPSTAKPSSWPTKKPFKKNFYNNGKPSKVYFVKPSHQHKYAKTF